MFTIRSNGILWCKISPTASVKTAGTLPSVSRLCFQVTGPSLLLASGLSIWNTSQPCLSVFQWQLSIYTSYSDMYLKEQWLQTSPEVEKLCNRGVFQHNPSLEKTCFINWACEFIPVVCWSSNRALIVEVADCDSLDTSWYIMVGLVSIAISCSDQSWRREAITWTTGWESVLY